MGPQPTDEATLRQASRQHSEPTTPIVALPDGSLDARTAHGGQLQPAVMIDKPGVADDSASVIANVLEGDAAMSRLGFRATTRPFPIALTLTE